ncbi:TPA: hypothetical protein NPN72_005304 [Klebsiella pneumoniae]|nr:hypothetical protein [Klebsiella pneumoniae]
MKPGGAGLFKTQLPSTKNAIQLLADESKQATLRFPNLSFALFSHQFMWLADDFATQKKWQDKLLAFLATPIFSRVNQNI